MSPIARLTGIVVIAVLFGAALGAGLMRRFQPPPPQEGVVVSAKGEPSAVFTPVDINDLPGWTQDSVAQAMPALKRSCAQYKNLPANTLIGSGLISRSAKVWQGACNALVLAGDSDASLRAVLARDFVSYAVSNSDGSGRAPGNRGTFTGYYEADLHGSLAKDANYQVPIYGMPHNLVTVNVKDFLPPSAPLPRGVPDKLVGRLVQESGDSAASLGGGTIKPFYTRSEIDADGAIAEDADVLLWANDPVAVHILHIQGSGRVTLSNGEVVRVGFAGTNGRAFRGIGSILMEAGELKAGGASMTDVREWLTKHPQEAAKYMNRNTRYIFFRRLDPAEAEDGPIGAFGVSLTPQRSIAVDRSYIPLGVPVWLDTVDPDGIAIQRLMVAQDVGTAITGPVRADFFWGHGEEAFRKAGRMKSSGRYFVFIPRPDAVQSASAAP